VSGSERAGERGTVEDENEDDDEDE